MCFIEFTRAVNRGLRGFNLHLIAVIEKSGTRCGKREIDAAV